MVDEPAAESLDSQVLDVYVSRDGGWWNPDHGDIDIPHGWAFLPAGNAYLTRTVSAAGAHWIAWQPGSRRGRHRRRLGVWAPEATIELAELQAERTQDARARARQRAATQRDSAEQAYRDKLAAAIVAWLAFDAAHADIAQQIARAAADHAAAVGSGRVGRTSTLTLDEKAALAARAHIRHHHTDYDERLVEDQAERGFVELDIEAYRTLRRDAHAAVDRFLDEHRTGES